MGWGRWLVMVSWLVIHFVCIFRKSRNGNECVHRSIQNVYACISILRLWCSDKEPCLLFTWFYRWIRDGKNVASESKLSTHPYLLTPFGHGTRMCAGRRFAEQDLYTVISRLVHKFRFQLVDENEQMEQTYNTLLFPKNPLQIRFIKRWREFEVLQKPFDYLVIFSRLCKACCTCLGTLLRSLF